MKSLRARSYGCDYRWDRGFVRHSRRAMRAREGEAQVTFTNPVREESTSAFAMLTPFKGALARVLEGLVLFAASCLRGHEPAIRARRFLHHAYWVRLPGRVFGHGSPKSGSARNGALLFVASFAGKVSDAAGFMRAHPIELDRIWKKSVHFPGATQYDDCLAFARRYERHADVSFDAYDAGVDEIRSALLLREKLDRLGMLHGGATDDEFLRAFEDLVKPAWGEQ
jgi:hypothetical protein